MRSGLFEIMLPTTYLFTNNIYFIYVYNKVLASNNLQRLICHKNTNKQPTLLNRIFTFVGYLMVKPYEEEVNNSTV